MVYVRKPCDALPERSRVGISPEIGAWAKLSTDSGFWAKSAGNLSIGATPAETDSENPTKNNGNAPP